MPKREQVRKVAQFTAVQRVRRLAAEAALQTARTSEQTARADETRARDQAEAAHREWGEHVGGTGFSPEVSRCLAAIVIEREQLAEAAATRVGIMTDLTAARQLEWQTREAQVRLSEASLKRISRKAERNREEKRLSDAADRVTFAWSRS
jgi:hypothetical protein